MKINRIMGGLCISLTISCACTLLLSKQMKAAAGKRPALDSYVVAKRPLDAGEVLRSEDLKVVAWPKSLPLVGAFENPGDLVGRAVLSPLADGQPFLTRDVSEVGSGAGLAAKIPDGMRAISLRSDEIVGVGGFLNPGSHVDMMVTLHSQTTADARTAIALQDATVLAAGQKIEPDPSGKPETVTVVTLLLSPSDAERAVLASSQGTVHFVLRNGSDRVVTDTAPLQLASLSGDAAATASPVAVHRHLRPPAVDAEVQTVLDGNTTVADASTPKGSQ